MSHKTQYKMETPPSLLGRFTPELVFTALAAVGGLAAYLNEYLETGIFSWGKMLAHILISAFAGLMFALVTGGMSAPQWVVYASAGVGGWMGNAAMDFISSYLRKRLEAQLPLTAERQKRRKRGPAEDASEDAAKD